MIEIRKKLVFMGTQVRVFATDPEESIDPFFAVPDIQEAIGMQNLHMLTTALDAEDIATVPLKTQGGLMNLLSVEGVNNCMLRSRIPEARAFRRWMFSTALPKLGTARSTIRRIDVVMAVTEALRQMSDVKLDPSDRAHLRDELFRILREEEGITRPGAYKLLKQTNDEEET